MGLSYVVLLYMHGLVNKQMQHLQRINVKVMLWHMHIL
jgi:hypothetical protein